MHIPFDAWITVLEMYPKEIIRNTYSYQNCACVEAEATWETSGPSPQFGCEPKNALKHCLLKKHSTAFPHLYLRINIMLFLLGIYPTKKALFKCIDTV